MTGLRVYAASARDPNEIAERVRSHMPLVRKIAWQVHGRVRDLFEIEDMIQIGMITLVEASQRYENNGVATFGAYASVRVRGALIDHLRKHLTLTRLGVQQRNQITAAELTIKAAGGDSRDSAAVAARLGITTNELANMHRYPYLRHKDGRFQNPCAPAAEMHPLLCRPCPCVHAAPACHAGRMHAIPQGALGFPSPRRLCATGCLSAEASGFYQVGHTHR
jgi:RNA polymerase sigma factor (sigma-70 family)